MIAPKSLYQLISLTILGFLLPSIVSSQGLVENKNLFALSPPVACTGFECDVTLSIVNRSDIDVDLDDFRIFIQPDLQQNQFTYTPDPKPTLATTEVVCTLSVDIPPHAAGSVKIQVPGDHIVYARIKDTPVVSEKAPNNPTPLLCWNITNSITGEPIAHACEELIPNGFVAPVATAIKGPLCDNYSGDCTCP